MLSMRTYMVSVMCHSDHRFSTSPNNGLFWARNGLSPGQKKDQRPSRNSLFLFHESENGSLFVLRSGSVTVPMAHASDDNKENTEPRGSAGGSNETEAESEVQSGTSKEECNEKSPEKEMKPKKNRCAICRKKVGLTGFQCRCGGLFCAVHRYSDKHECTFDYREMGAQEIRRNNPVVVGEKIQKI